MGVLYKLSFFVTNKINLIDFKPKILKLPTFGKGKRKLTALFSILMLKIRQKVFLLADHYKI